MATHTFRPDGDSSNTNFSPSSAYWAEVDDTVDSHDSDTTKATATSFTAILRATATATPGDFGSCNTLNVRVVAKQAGRVDDTLTISAVATGVPGVLSSSAALTATEYTEFSTGATARTPSQAQLDATTVGVDVTRSSSGMADAITVSVTAVEVVMDYTASGPATEQPYYHRTGGVPGMRIGRPGSVFGRSW